MPGMFITTGAAAVFVFAVICENDKVSLWSLAALVASLVI
jgi:hypothetical protein